MHGPRSDRSHASDETAGEPGEERQHPAKLGLQYASFQQGAKEATLWTARGLALTSVDTWTSQDSGRVNVSNNDLV